MENLSSDVRTVSSSLTTMLEQEEAHYSVNLPQHFHETTDIASDRRKIADWCFGVVDFWNFERQLVSQVSRLIRCVRLMMSRALLLLDRILIITSSLSLDTKAMNMADRVLSTNQSYDSGTYQMLAVVSLFTALKASGEAPPTAAEYARACGGTYTKDEIVAVELYILQKLSWRIWAPGSLQVAHHILSLMKARLVKHQLDRNTWDSLVDEVHFQTECATREGKLASVRGSSVAVVSILNAIDLVQEDRIDWRLMGITKRERLDTALMGVLKGFHFGFDLDKMLIAERKALKHAVRVADEIQSKMPTHDAAPKEAKSSRRASSCSVSSPIDTSSRI